MAAAEDAQRCYAGLVRIAGAWGGAVGKTCLLRIAGVGTPLQPCRSPIVALVNLIA